MANIVIGPEDALIVIDMEIDFDRPEGRLYVAGVDGEVERTVMTGRIRELARQPFGLKVKTRDEHQEGHIEFSIFGLHCPEGDAGAEIIPELAEEMAEFDLELVKGQDKNIISYSVAMSPDFPRLMAELRNRGIKRIFLAGLAYTHCVGESAIILASQLFEICVIRDATRSVAPPYGDPERTSRKLELYGVREINTSDII